LTQRIKEYNKDIAKAKENVCKLIGTKFRPRTGDLKPLWMVVSNIDSVRTPVVDQQTRFSLLLKKKFDAFLLFWKLWPGDIDLQLHKNEQNCRTTDEIEAQIWFINFKMETCL